MKHVPEGSITKTTEQQLTILRETLAGNQAFAACRGKFGTSLNGITSGLIENAESPTMVLNQWDEFMGKARVMTNILAQFKRDGEAIAYSELVKALTNPKHLLPGEIIPIEKTEPVTVLMLDPERTMLMIKWIIENHWMDLNYFLDWSDGNLKGPRIQEPSDRVKELFVKFPTLEKHARNRRECREYEGGDLAEAHNDAVLQTFSPQVREMLTNTEKGQIAWGQWNDHVEIGDHTFVYFFRAEQSDVLKMFSREEQSRIATWQFDVAKTVENKFVNIGIHPECMSSTEQCQPAFPSKGTSHGYRAIIFEGANVASDRSHLYKTFEKFGNRNDPYGIVFTLRK